MRIFVGYGYSQRDQWVEQLVFPLLNALRCEVVHGKVMYGETLAPAIKSTILSCDALMGFTTRREQFGDKWSTHRWVVEELATAFGQIEVVEIREQGVDLQLGMLGSTQHIVYDADHRDRCLVEIAQAVSRISETVSHTTFRLEPVDFVTQFRSLVNKPGVKCTYRVMRRNVEFEFKDAKIWRAAGGLSISVDGLRAGDLIQLCVSYGAQSWSSDYEPVDAIRISLVKEE